MSYDLVAVEEEDWARVRDAYPRQQPLMNLNNAAVSPPPLVVQDAMIDAYRLISQNPDVNMWNKLDAALPAIKQKLAAMADCAAEEIALNRNSTEGLCTAIFGIPLVPGDQVLMCDWDYPSMRAAWLQRQEREGIEIASVAFDPMDSDDAVFAAYEQAITPRTRVMHLTQMLHWTGRVLPMQRLCDFARSLGIITVVDGAQTFAQMPFSFRQLGCDYFATSLHKWLGAPVGNGMLIVKESRIDATFPLLAPFDPPPLRIDKFDHWNLGTYNSAIQAGIIPAVQFHQSIGTSAVHARLQELTRYWVELASKIPGFRLHTPLDTDALGAVTLFSVDGMESKRLEQRLRDDYSIHTKFRQAGAISGLRVSPHIYMLKEDLDTFVECLSRAVAAG